MEKFELTEKGKLLLDKKPKAKLVNNGNIFPLATLTDDQAEKLVPSEYLKENKENKKG